MGLSPNLKIEAWLKIKFVYLIVTIVVSEMKEQNMNAFRDDFVGDLMGKSRIQLVLKLLFSTNNDF